MVNEDGSDVTLSLSIYPPDSGEGAIRQVGFNFGGTINVLMEIGLDENNDPTVRLTVGGGPEATVEGLEDIADMFDTVSELLRTEEFQTGWQIARDKQIADADIEAAYADEDNYDGDEQDWE